MNVIRETVRVAKEYLEKLKKSDPSFYETFHTHEQHVRKDQESGHLIISNFLGGPWKQEGKRRYIAEALAQLRAIEGGVIKEEAKEANKKYTV